MVKHYKAYSALPLQQFILCYSLQNMLLLENVTMKTFTEAFLGVYMHSWEVI